jgi:hypothetical protein
MSDDLNQPRPTDADATLRQRMAEVACLPTGHPLRAPVEKEVAERGGEWPLLWQTLQGDDDAFRSALADVPVPPSLTERLLAIPDEAASPMRIAPSEPAPRWNLFVPFSLAAAVLLTIGLWVGVFRPSAIPHELAVKQIAMSIDDVEIAPTVTTSNWSDVEGKLSSAVPFPVKTPTLRRPMQLVSAGAGMIAGRMPVVRSTWTDGGLTYDLFQFRAGDFGLTKPITRTELCPMLIAGRGAHNCRIVLWTEEGRDYALVVDPGDKPTPELPI